MRRLVVNADDFGFTEDVNEGILRGHLDGIVRSASLMANGAAFEDAVRIARRHPTLGVGCHLTLAQGESLSRPGTRLPSSLLSLLASPPTFAEARREFQAQADRLLRSGIVPTHLDSHKHVHLLPSVLDAALTVATRVGVGWIRKPFDAPFGLSPGVRACLAVAVRPWRVPFEERVRKARCRTADYFAGFMATGRLDALWLARLLRRLPHGIGELVCHPGICGPQLLAADTRLKASREAELRALCSSRVRRAVSEVGIELVSYRELAAKKGDAGSP
ncbi:MAG: ChbG/HpnK family deacetylase [Bryobacterales bacterium]|nr:ChbG/HpnK family deacetylase [Bryobacterales bacterium]